MPPSPHRLLNLKRLALKNVIEFSINHHIEKTYRYYSKTYATPLHIAKEALTAEEVLLIYYEDKFEELSKEELNDIKKELTSAKSPVFSDINFTEAESLSDDEAWIAEQNRLLKEQEKKAKNNTKVEESINKANEALSNFAKELGKNFSPDEK
jgi:hypothetical protein